MLTVDTLRQNSILAELTDSQLNAIAEMSRNDENTVIGAKIGALHGQYDADILTISGVKKNEGEKSYDYAKRVIGEYKAKAELTNSLQAELDSEKIKAADLQAKLEKGGSDEAIAQQLRDAKNQVSQLQAQLTAKTAELTAKQSDFDKTLLNTHIDYAFQAASAGLKFKDGITEAIQKTLLGAAKSEVLSKGTPDFIEEQGQKKLIFRDSAGNILNNPGNNLNPYTLKELIMESSLKDALDSGRSATGGGTIPPSGSGNKGVIDLSGAKTQIEADKAIESYLLAEGLTRDSQDFADRSLQIRTENKVAELPLR